MTLRKKLTVAFLGMLILPVVLVSIIGFVTIQIQMHHLNREYDADYSFFSVVKEPLQVMYQITEEPFDELLGYIPGNTEKFQNTDYLNSINNTLKNRYSYLVVTQEEATLFSGDRSHFEALGQRIKSSIAAASQEAATYIDAEEPLLVKHGFFNYPDGVNGSFMIITKVSPIVDNIKKSIVAILVIGAIAIAVTAVSVSAWLFQGVLRPIDDLRKASREIGSGNLNYKVERKSADEIGQLCDDFEEMRRHLKTQIDAKEQFEIDSREMISNISHDLKTPLTAIKGYAEGMLDGVAETPEKRQKYLKTIVARATDMTGLVDELSYYSKLDTNKLPYKFETVPANAYFGDCVEENSLELEMKDFEISFQTEIPNDVNVIMDCEQIRRVMNNLIGNAVKYRNEEIHGVLAVKVTDAEDSVRISVVDNGIGISKEALPHIFDRFYRADKSRTAGRAGTGLGLAIVKKIVVEHGGRVFARSEIGKGTTISFTVKKGAA